MNNIQLILKTIGKRSKLLYIILLTVSYTSLLTLWGIEGKIKQTFSSIPQMIQAMITLCIISFIFFILIVIFLRIFATKRYLKLYKYIGYPPSFTATYYMIDIAVLNVTSALIGILMSEITVFLLWKHIESLLK